MKVIALVAPPADPALAGAAYRGMLGEGFDVDGFAAQEHVPDDVAVVAEAIIAAAGCAVDAGLLKRAPNVRLIQVPGHGYDHIALQDAAAAGVPVATVASSGAEAHTVAEMAILLAGAAGRRIPAGDRFVREGRWGVLEMLQTGIFELAGSTIGIVGLGRIGREVAKRARAFDMRVVYTDALRPPPEEEERLGVEFRDFDALLAESDVVTLHAPLTPQTRGLIGERALALMKQTAVLVNTARGPLVDAAALSAALRAGKIRAAAIDVFDTEPPGPGNPLLGCDNVVLSPHMAGVTAESIMRILAAAMENVRRLARGEPILDVVGPPIVHQP